MSKNDERAAKLLAAAQHICPHERIEGLFTVARPTMDDWQCTPWRKRPWVLQQPQVKNAPISKAFSVVMAIVTLEVAGPLKLADSSEERASMRSYCTKTSTIHQSACQMFGSAESAAGRLLVATLPRSKAEVLQLLCVTQNELKLLYVPYTRRMKYFANAVEVGWRVPRRELEWVRSTAWKRGNAGTQYGFTDGSWMSLHTAPVAGQPSLDQLFPGMLTKSDPIPPNAHYPEPETTK